jgi:hypothetical protein
MERSGRDLIDVISIRSGNNGVGMELGAVQ